MTMNAEQIALIPRGWARLQPTAENVKTALEEWQRVSNKYWFEKPFDELETQNQSTVYQWADENLDISAKYEKGDMPLSHAISRDGRVFLSWDGTFTEGRFLDIIFEYDNGQDEPSGVVVQWDTATGEPSTFLRTEKFMECAIDWGDDIERVPTIQQH